MCYTRSHALTANILPAHGYYFALLVHLTKIIFVEELLKYSNDKIILANMNTDCFTTVYGYFAAGNNVVCQIEILH